MPTSPNNNIRGSGARQTKNTKHITYEGPRSPRLQKKSKTSLPKHIITPNHGARSPEPPRKSKPPKR